MVLETRICLCACTKHARAEVEPTSTTQIEVLPPAHLIMHVSVTVTTHSPRLTGKLYLMSFF